MILEYGDFLGFPEGAGQLPEQLTCLPSPARALLFARIFAIDHGGMQAPGQVNRCAPTKITICGDNSQFPKLGYSGIYVPDVSQVLRTPEAQSVASRGTFQSLVDNT